MLVKQNIQVSSISWIKSGKGKIENLYYPDTIEEMVDLCRLLLPEQKSFDIIGHTSNILFRDTYNPSNVISTLHLKGLQIDNDVATCENGVPSSRFAREMVNIGASGFEGLINLPGTVGAAIAMNAGCFDCLMTDNLLYVDFLSITGETQQITKEQLRFSRRSSDIKRGQLKGVILRAYFKIRKGDIDQLKAKAEENSRIRKETQPGPAQNLGSVFGYMGKATLKYKFLRKAIKLKYILLHHRKASEDDIVKTTLKIFHKSYLCHYIEKTRWIWKDDKAYGLFDEYVEFMKKLYPSLTIEIVQKN